MTTIFPFAGQSFQVSYGELVAINSYAADGRNMTYTITAGPAEGASGTVTFEWRQLPGGCFAISWQEADGATVTHVDDFAAMRSLSYYTTPDHRFLRMEGTLAPIAA